VFLFLRTFLLPATPFAATDDQSLFFARAVRIVQGQVPYRDFFEIVTPVLISSTPLGFASLAFMHGSCRCERS
jgi:hypothetical protein